MNAPATLHGSAAFSDELGAPLVSYAGTPALLLGGPNALLHPVAGPQHNHGFAIAPDRHLLTIGPTRSGKGVGGLIPNLLSYGGPVLVVDPKGENAWRTAAHRAAMGQTVHIIDPWGEVQRRYGARNGATIQTARFNPLHGLDPVAEDYADDLAMLADALIVMEGKDPHWSNSARELVAGLIADAVETLGPGATLKYVRSALTLPASVLRQLCQDAVARDTESMAARKLARFAEESDEILSVISTALTQTAFLDSAALVASMAASDMTLDALGNGRTTIYLVLPVDKLLTHGKWLRLLLTVAIRAVARLPEPPSPPVLMMLDEMGSGLGRLNAVATAYGLMAGLGLCIWGFVQDLNQLIRDYDEEWETFLANCGAVQCFRAFDQTTARYLSELLGNTTVTVRTMDVSKQKLTLFGGPQTVNAQGGEQWHGRPLLYPDEVRRLDGGHVLVLRAGARPVLAHKIEYFHARYPAFATLYRADVLDAQKG